MPRPHHRHPGPEIRVGVNGLTERHADRSRRGYISEHELARVKLMDLGGFKHQQRIKSQGVGGISMVSGIGSVWAQIGPSEMQCNFLMLIVDQ
jgi:hypothetical protein